MVKSKTLSKSRNYLNFGAKKAKPIFLTFDIRTIFNCLRLAFTKTLILQHFDPKYYIWIKIDVLSNVIDRILSQLTSKISCNKIVTKANLG